MSLSDPVKDMVAVETQALNPQVWKPNLEHAFFCELLRGLGVLGGERWLSLDAVRSSSWPL